MQKTVHIDKVNETLNESSRVEDYEWYDGEVQVWFDFHRVPHTLIGDLVAWGMVVKTVDFDDNLIKFAQQGHAWD